MSEAPIQRALDPALSVVVEACAGSGKTWLLVSRLLRLLLAGARPGEILAITYTRKAAREIEERLRLWLRQLAVLPEPEALRFLTDRGLADAEAARQLPRARGLLEALFEAEPPITITTFHGWFARLMGGAPLSTGMAGFRLTEAAGPLLEEAWERFARHCGKSPEAPEARALVSLFSQIGQLRTRSLLHAFVERRAEWHAFLDDGSAGLDEALARLEADLGVLPGQDPIADFFAQPGLTANLETVARLLALNTATDQNKAIQLRAALEMAKTAKMAGVADLHECYAALRGVFLTQAGSPCAIKPSAAQAKRLQGEESLYLSLRQQIAEDLVRVGETLLETRILALNREVFTAACGLLAQLEASKKDSRQMDFTDLEWHADRLLADPEVAPFLQARLDARYRHILLDEFQDTNPLQWRILLAWLEAYGADGSPPRVFLVGDPKQSIYRFRRADYRIFTHASGWLQDQFGAVRIENDRTFRNAPALVEVVNALFSHEPDFLGFRPQTAVRSTLPGRVELLPLVSVEAPAGAEAAAGEGGEGGLRDPLHCAPSLAEDLRRQAEARLLAERLQAIVGHWAVQGEKGTRPAHWGDVLILTRRRTILPEYERALRDAGIPYLSVSRGGLLRTLEAADLAALLRWLASPADDLALVHALRTPLFGISDGDLLVLAGREEPRWWARLQAEAGQGAASLDELLAPETPLQRAARLLARWQGLANFLPVHDLLDKVFHEGELIARYRAVVPEAMEASVRANLEAFIALSLQVDAGRYPSLPRFIDELGRLARAGDEEAPDEGVILADGEAAGRVRIMTIHGAKGLEAPIVWLIDARNGRQRRDSDCVLLDWPPGEARPRHFSMVTRKDEQGSRREAMFAAEEAARVREDLNLLYVAITRASQYFLASGIQPSRGGTDPNPWERIAAALERLGAQDGTYGLPPQQLDAAAGPAPALPEALPPAVPIGSFRDETPADENLGALFGTDFHQCLEALTEGLPTTGLPAQPLELARRLLAREELAVFFDPARYAWALNEMEFVDRFGRVGRVDRLVDDGETLWVLDYKTGTPDAALMDDYRTQLARYRSGIAGLWPGRPVRCALILASGELREIN